MKKQITFYCCLCSAKVTFELDVINGWIIDDQDFEGCFCPNHSIIAEFKHNCSGCVGGWYDCDLWRSFAYGGIRTLDENDFAIIRSGRCPKRINGTFTYQNNKIESFDLSEHSSVESGMALEKAIKDWWIRFPKEK